MTSAVPFCECNCMPSVIILLLIGFAIGISVKVIYEIYEKVKQ
jgi:hypothetical protein